jgi:hypothetical protein
MDTEPYGYRRDYAANLSVVPAAEPPHERLVRRGKREVPDQLGTARLGGTPGEPLQLRQLISAGNRFW